jgi:hypothetical protein
VSRIFSLVSDINALFLKGCKPSQENVDALGKSVAEVVASSLQEPFTEKTPTLRMSNIGRKDRQIWYDFHHKQEPESLPAAARIKFLFGHILERMLIFLAKEAGHDVQDIQKEVSVQGIVGHQDATVDGVTVDAKSCSSFSFQKFRRGDLQDDPFGYIAQLAGYSAGNGGTDGAFLAIDKQHGDLTLLAIGRDRLAEYEIDARISRIKDVILQADPPERCYVDEDYGKSGNKALAVGCSYCRHKFECWADANEGKGLRTFLYSGKPVFFTEVKREPAVPELHRS